MSLSVFSFVSLIYASISVTCLIVSLAVFWGFFFLIDFLVFDFAIYGSSLFWEISPLSVIRVANISHFIISLIAFFFFFNYLVNSFFIQVWAVCHHHRQPQSSRRIQGFPHAGLMTAHISVHYDDAFLEAVYWGSGDTACKWLRRELDPGLPGLDHHHHRPGYSV